MTCRRLPIRGARRPVLAVQASGLFGRRMCRAGWRGFTLPLPFVTVVFFWLHPGESPDPRVVVHEAAHAIQIEAHGVIRFVTTYLTDLFRHGYWDIPYERAAREADQHCTELDAERLRAFLG